MWDLLNPLTDASFVQAHTLQNPMSLNYLPLNRNRSERGGVVRARSLDLKIFELRKLLEA